MTTLSNSSRNQCLFIRYLIGILLNLTVIGLIDEYWQYLSIESFSVVIQVAILLQIFLKSTMKLESKISKFFQRKKSNLMKFLKGFFVWLLLVSSKFIMLGIIDLIFGNEIIFNGPFNGMLAFVIVVIAMLMAEQTVVWTYNHLD